MLYKNFFLTLLSFLFSVQTCLYATQTPEKEQYHKIRAVIKTVKKKLSTQSSLPMPMLPKNKNLSGADLTKVQLPQDLSYANLRGANLAGHHFTHTNFTGAQLSGVILTGTTCDYRKCFQYNYNVQPNKLKWGKWYLENLPKDLKSIAQVYPKLAKNSQKAKLLQIACGLAYLSYYEKCEFYIKLEYWSCQLFMLKKQLPHLGKRLVCSLGSTLKDELEKYSWETDYPYYLDQGKGMKIAAEWCILATYRQLPSELCRLIQYYLTEPPQKIHANFDRYLALFQAGFVKYNVQFKVECAYDHYKDTIERNIQGLKKAYPTFTTQKLRKEAMEIAAQLSQKYKVQDWALLSSFLDCQNRLIQLRSSAEAARAAQSEASPGVVVNNIYYNASSIYWLF